MDGNITHTEIKKKGISVFTKFIISFLFLILNIETILYLVLQTDSAVVIYQKVLVFVILMISLFFFFKWNKGDRICFLFFILLVVKLIVESFVNYRSILIYPSVFAVMFPFLYVYFIKNLFKHLNIDILKAFIVFIFLGYFLFMFFHGSEFDLSYTTMPVDAEGPYSGDSRILHANSILLIVLPFLYFLNKLFSKHRSSLSIIGFIVSLIIILIHQHRTVWVTTIFSTLFLLFLKGNEKKLLRRVGLVTLIIAGIFVLTIFTVPGFGQILLERFSDVLDPLNEDNTGGFRYLQVLAYLNYFIQKPIFGWTFSGFELSNPFIENWEEGSGHHFHDAYIEVLFYFGIIGFLMKYYPLYSIARKIKKQLSDRSKILAAFSIAGFIYSFSAVPPLIFWGIVGVCLYSIERDLKISTNNNG